ncbi:Germ line transcription factor 1 [Carabus blaptoides fortunei]
MSRDIRSYFTSLSKKPAAPSSNNKTTVTEVAKSKKRSVTSLDSSSDDVIPGTPQASKKITVKTGKDAGRSKRRRIVAHSSDSETEQSTGNNKSTNEKLRVKVKQKAASSVNKTKENGSSAVTVIEKKKLISPLAAFGDGPVKQSKVNKHHGTEVNIHGDEDFDKTLLELDEEQLLKQCVNTSTVKEVLTSPRVVVPIVDKKPEFSAQTSTPHKHKSQDDSKQNTTKTPTHKRKTSDSEESGMDPDQERHEKKRMSAMLYQKYLNRSGPAHLGSKWIPKGKANCLKGLCFIITGVLESMQRDEAQALVVEHGGRCTQSVSGKVNYMILGEDAGPAKDEIPAVTVKHCTPKKTSKVKPELQSPARITSSKSTVTGTYDLAWVDKYKPNDVNQIIGQQGDRSNVNKLTNWLQHWYRNHDGHTKLTKPSPWAKNDDGGYFKAALLSGPPGVGKTTTATLVSRKLGFDVVEFNASDTRNKRMIHEEIASLLRSTSLRGYFTDGSAPSKKHVLLMDEVDGMSGNEDRGGMQELIALIKESQVPVICMCNDRQHPKIRTLANYCFDLRFSKPRVEQIRGAMMSICYKEGVKIGVDALTQIIEGTGMDVRQTLNHLSMWSAQEDGEPISRELAERKAHASRKDVKLGPWEVIRKVFSAEEHKSMTLADKSKLFFYDYSIGPLFVQENYLKVVPHCPKRDMLQRFAAAADCISLGDVVDAKIRSSQNWSLLELEAMYASVMPGHHLAGHMAGQIDFPGWLGKNSKTNKFNRMLGEVYAHTRTSMSGNKNAVNLDYLPFLRDAIVRPMAERGADGIPDALHTMQAYSLLREDLTSILELSHWPKTKDPFETGVESKVKAAFTRAYNKQCAVLPYSNSAAVRKKRATAEENSGLEGYTEDGEAAVESADEENDDDITVDAMIKAKKPTAAKTVAKGGSNNKAKKAPAKPRTTKKLTK